MGSDPCIQFDLPAYPWDVEVTLNSALSAISAGDDLDRWRVATGLLESFATQAEILTWNACLCACSRCAQWLAALGFFLQLQQRSLEASRVTEVTVLEACSSRAPWPHCIALTGAGPTAALNAAAARVSRAAAASAAQLGLLGRLRHPETRKKRLELDIVYSRGRHAAPSPDPVNIRSSGTWTCDRCEGNELDDV
eukprot:g12630.t1